MARFDSPLNNLRVASPCSQDWSAMIGDERRRYCGECKLNVYNLTGMTRAEAEDLIGSAEGRLCVRFYRRADGSVLTADCPVGWRAVRRRVSRTAAAFISLVVGFLSGVGMIPLFERKDPLVMGEMVRPINTTPDNEQITPLMGAIAPALDEDQVAGNAVRAETTTPNAPIRRK